MAGKKENIKALFSNTRSRVIIIFTVALLLIAVIVGVIKLTTSFSSPTALSSANLADAPSGLQSIPGSMDQTEQYASLQQAQNIAQAKQAATTGGSAIPTIIRTQAFGDGVEAIGPQQGQGGVGFETLAREDSTGGQQSLWIQSLKDSNCSKVTVNSVVNQGAVISDLKGVCSCVQLKDNGYKLSDLKPVCSCKELKASGFNARQMKDAGSTAGQLRLCGFDACELRAAGYTAQDMKDGGYSDGELKGAGYPDNEISRAGGLPDGITFDDINKAGCQPDALARLRTAGVSASAIRQASGCSVAQLKAAGYSAQDLKNAGFSAADLLKSGFLPADFKQAGFGARDLLDAGLTPADLAAAGYSADDIKTAEAELPSGITADSVKNAGCGVEALKRERLAGVSAILMHKYAGCSAQQLNAAGFTTDDLANAGFTPAELKLAPSTIPAVEPVADNAIRSDGCDPEKLHELFLQNVSAKRIHDLNGCSAAALKAAGYDAKALADAGFTPQDLLAAGFTPQDLTQANLSPTGVIAAGRTANCSVESLKAAHALGVSATTIKQTLGCGTKQMKDAGYTAAELKAAGFTAAELKDAGFSPADLKNAGFTGKELRAAGFSAQQLKDAGFSPVQLKDAGFSAADLKNAGLSAEQLKAAGFSAKDLKDAGFAADALQKARFSEQDLKDAGFSPDSSSVAGLDVQTQPKESSAVVTLPPLEGVIAGPTESAEAANTKQLQEILKRQQGQMADQRYQQKIQQRTAAMLGAANTSLQDWKTIASQVYVSGTPPKTVAGQPGEGGVPGSRALVQSEQPLGGMNSATASSMIKAGDVLFAVLDTSVNSDEPGPILATIVSGKLNGSKLIGSFTLPTNADRMVINFNTMSVPGAPKTTSINAYAIDPNTARTALKTKANHHYLLRYGSLFAATFLEGFGNAFQSANTTVTIGGTGGVSNTTIANGAGRSIIENAVIGLATLGKSWGQVAQQQFNTPTTVLLCSGTGIGVLFTQDLASL